MKRTFQETISLLIGAIISIGIVLITFSARAEDAPASEKNEVYAQTSKLSLILLEQITKDQDKEILDTVWTSIFVYDLLTGNQIAKGGVKFYFSQLQSLNADAASENVENGTEED